MLPSTSWWSAPCWPVEQADRQLGPCLHVEVSPLRKKGGGGGKGNNFGFCAIKNNHDSLRTFSLLLPEEKWAIPGGFMKCLVASLGWLVQQWEWLKAHTLHSMPFQYLQSAFSPLKPPSLPSKTKEFILSCASRLSMVPARALTLQKGKGLWETDLFQTSNSDVLFFSFCCSILI